MSKIEDETARGLSHRSAASASIDEASNVVAEDDFDAAPVVVPASDDWSVDDDDSSTGKSATDSRLREPAPEEWVDQQIPGLERPNSSNGTAASNGVAPVEQTRRSAPKGSAPKVKRFAADRVAPPETERIDASPAREAEHTTDQGAASRVGDPLIAPRAGSKIEDTSSTGRLPVTIDDDSVDDEGVDNERLGDSRAKSRIGVGDTGPVPLIIHEQTAIEDHDSRTPVIDRDDVDHAFDDPWDTSWGHNVPVAATSQTAVINYGTPAAGVPLPAVQPEISRRRRVRRVNRVLRHVDPWSVFKVGLLFNLIGYIVVMTSGVALWDVASRTGTLPNIERWATQFGWETFALDGGAIFRNAAVAGLFGAVGLTGAMVMFATVFNLVSDAIGGIRVSVLEEEVVAIADDGSVVAPSMSSMHDHDHAEDWAIEDF